MSLTYIKDIPGYQSNSSQEMCMVTRFCLYQVLMVMCNYVAGNRKFKKHVPVMHPGKQDTKMNYFV